MSLCTVADTSLLSDFFRGPTVSAVRLAGLEHVLHFTALDGKIYMRSYRYNKNTLSLSHTHILTLLGY